MANNKVVLGSVTIIDISDTTAEAQDVAKDKVFYGADGNRVIGTAEEGPTPTGTLSITENGTYDVTNYANADVNVSGGGGMTETLLWENPHPTAAFDTLSTNIGTKDTADYKFVKITFLTSASSGVLNTAIFEAEGKSINGCIGDQYYARKLTTNTSRGYTFAKAYMLTTSASSTLYILPQAIYGLK